MELSLEQRQIAIAMVDYLRAQGYILSPQEYEELQEYRKREDSWICGTEVANMLGCSRANVTQLKRERKLKYRLEGSRPMYSVKSVNQYIKRRTIEDSTVL